MKGKQLYLFRSHKDSEKSSGRYRIIFHLDTLILLSVVIILLLTFSFSLGVERGKKNVARDLGNQRQELAGSTNPTESLQPEKTQEQKKQTTQLQDNTSGENIEKKEKKKLPRYNIQVASFQRENSAQRAAESLKKKGYPVLIKKKQGYVVVYVGSFDNEKEAKSSLNLLRQTYKDCILRRL